MRRGFANRFGDYSLYWRIRPWGKDIKDEETMAFLWGLVHEQGFELELNVVEDKDNGHIFELLVYGEAKEDLQCMTEPSGDIKEDLKLLKYGHLSDEEFIDFYKKEVSG